MALSLRVHTTHNIEYECISTPPEQDSQAIIIRLKKYCKQINKAQDKNFYVHLLWEGVDALEYEVDIALMKILSEKPIEFFKEHPEDLALIQNLYAKGDKNNDVIYISYF